MGRVTLQTIADQVGVSRMTVSNAFSRPDQLSPALRERILATADELGYAGPDAAGRALARGRSGLVGIVLTDSPYDAFSDEVSTRFLGAITRELAPRGLAVALLPASSDGDLSLSLPLDASIVYSCSPGPSIEALRRRGLPMVRVDDPPEPGSVTVNIDDYAGARAAAEHVLQLGHRRVGLLITSSDVIGEITGDPLAHTANHVTSERLRGWLEPLRAAEATVLTWACDHDTEEQRSALIRDVLLGDHPPTALLCISDRLAEQVLRVAVDAGVDVPADLSVVGFDDAPIALRAQPPLTTVRQDLDAKGRATALSLMTALDAARAGGTVSDSHLTLPTALIIRESTSPAPGSA